MIFCGQLRCDPRGTAEVIHGAFRVPALMWQWLTDLEKCRTAPKPDLTPKQPPV